MAELARVEVVIVPALAQQFRVRAHLGDAASFDYQNSIGAFDRAEAVRDDERRAILHQHFHAALNQRFGQRIDGTRRLVEDEQLRLRQHCARQADQLLLTRRE